MGDDGNSGFDSGVDYGGGMAGSDGLSGLSGGGLSTGDYSGDIGYGGSPDFGGGFDSGVDFGISPYSDFSFSGTALGSNIDSSIADQGWGLSNIGFGQEEDNSIWGKIGKFAQTPLGRFAQAALARANPVAGMVTGMLGKANQASQSPSKAGGVFGGVVGGTLGSMFGPVGSMIGGYAGNQIGSNAFSGVNNQGISGQPTGTGNSNPMDFATGAGMGLASLYQNYKNQKGLKGQIGTLQGMYGQGSPYAQALRQQLERRDAAGGRRSQYGPREVELQAQLARMASGNAPTLANLYAQQRGQRGQNLAQLAGLYQQMGGWQGIRGGFNDLFGGMDLDTNGMGMGEISGGASADYFDPIYGD